MHRINFTEMREIETSLRDKLRQELEVGAPQELTGGGFGHDIRVSLKSPSGSDLVFEINIEERRGMFFVAGVDVKARARMVVNIDPKVVSQELGRFHGDVDLLKTIADSFYRQVVDWIRENR